MAAVAVGWPVHDSEGVTGAVAGWGWRADLSWQRRAHQRAPGELLLSVLRTRPAESTAALGPIEAPMLVDDLLSFGLPSLIEPVRPMPKET